MTWTFLWTICKVLILLAGMLLLAKYLPIMLRRTAVLPQNRSLQLLETLHLGVDRTVYLIKAGNEQLVVGGGRNGLRLLARLPANLHVDEINIPEEVR